MGLFITTLVAGIDHVYHAPADRIALKRPIFTTGSVDIGDPKLPRFPFSVVASAVLKSQYIVAYGIREAVSFTVLSPVLHTK